jgi:flagellar biosynthesis protein FlhB
VPVKSPVGDKVSPVGTLVPAKEVIERSERVVAENWMGVIVRFCTKLKRDDETSAIVITSFRTANLKSLVAVAGVPVALAVIVTVVRGVIVVGVPTSWIVLEPTLEKLSPVPARAGALKVTGFPDAALAVNWMFEG